MPYSMVKLSQLHVNHHNDRHGELLSEAAAIGWLLKNRGSHMKSLTKDIVSEGRVYEPPLVHKGKDGFLVLDGNRRITCLKLLSKPSLSSNASWASFFQKEAKNFFGGTIPTEVECRVETDLDFIDEVLYRRHTGSQNGVGQSQWGDEAKSNFVERSGKKSKIHIAEEVESLLKKAGLIDTTFKIPRSNLNRLLSGQAQRNRVGLSLNKNMLTFTHDPEIVASSLKRIVEDLASKKIILPDIWDIQGKTTYLDNLDGDNVLPTASDGLSTPIAFEFPYPKVIKKPKKGGKKTDSSDKTPTGGGSGKSDKRGKPYDHSSRPTLIPQGFEYNIPKKSELNRLLAIWNELEWHLTFDKHVNAISVLFRVLLELSIEHYAGTSGCKLHINDKMKNKFEKVIQHQLAEGMLDKKQIQILKKFANTEPLLSAHTMNQYVHSKSFSPSPEHLRPMWDNIQQVILNCLTQQKK